MKIWLPFLALFLGTTLFSQRETTLYFHVDKITVKNKIILDSTFAKRYKDKALTQFKLQGYTGLYLKDSTVKSNVIHFFYGYENHFEKIILTPASDSLSKKTKLYKHKDYLAVLKTINREITLLENSGFPFASVQIIDQTEDKNKLLLTYQIDSGLFFTIDKITIKSKSKFHDQTILNLTALKVGEAYDESKIRAVDQLIRSSGLYKLMRPVEVLFRPGKAELFIYIEKENSSDADGYVGFQQDKTTEKLVLNGFFNLSLHNAFNRAETFQVNWKNNPNKTQNLKLNLEVPYILQTPIGLGTRLNLQKQDSSFVRADAFFDVSYLNPFYRIGVYYQLENSTTLLKTIPSDLRDYKKNTIGLSVKFKPLLPEPYRFYHPIISMNGGFFKYRADSIDANSSDESNSKYTLRYEHVIDFFKYFHLNNSLQFDGLTSSQNLSRNELIYFGGLKSIRGFYELELTGNDVIVVTNEIEFAPVEVLSFKILYDYAQYHYGSFNRAQAIGFGFSFSTGNVKLEIILANGWENTNPIELSNSKIHLGFKSSF